LRFLSCWIFFLLFFFLSCFEHRAHRFIPSPSTVFCAFFGWFFASKSLDLDLLFPTNFRTTRASPVGSSASSESTDSLRAPHRCPLAGASSARARDIPGACGPRLLLPPLPTTACGVLWWLQRLPLARGLLLAARSHAPPEVAPTPLPSSRPLLLVIFLFLLLLLCFVLGLSVVTSLYLSMYRCLSSSDSLYILYHLNWWPRFLASVSRIIGPASSVALPPHTFVLSLNFVLPGPCFCYFPLLL
jgi:hypothetical protein